MVAMVETPELLSNSNGRDPSIIGQPDAAERRAAISTLSGSCRRRRINPFGYLRGLFMRWSAALIAEIKSVTPAEWAKAKVSRQAH